MPALRLLDPNGLEEHAVGTVIASRQMAANARAFDSVAAVYDAANRHNLLLEAMRARSLAMLARHVPPGSRVLDLGCGPGTDFEALLARNYRVTAIENAPRMVAQARARAHTLGRRGTLTVVHLAIEQIESLSPESFDAAYSSFGPFNCVTNLQDAAEALAARLRPGGVFVASVIGRFCPWEIVCYLWKRNPRRIALRFARQFVRVPLGGHSIWTRYYWPREFEQPFITAGFARLELCALGLFTPPPYMDAVAQRCRAGLRLLASAERRFAHVPMLRACGDHFLIALRKP
jgi:SAM-dependent methyltransferase